MFIFNKLFVAVLELPSNIFSESKDESLPSNSNSIATSESLPSNSNLVATSDMSYCVPVFDPDQKIRKEEQKLVTSREKRRRMVSKKIVKERNCLRKYFHNKQTKTRG